MRFVAYLLDYKCNNNCIFCTRPADPNVPNIWDRERSKTIEDVKKDFKRMRENKIEGIILTGGEPTIRRDFFEVLELCKVAGFKTVSIQTNGRIFSRKSFVGKLTEFSPMLDVFLSFHTHKKPLFEKLVGTRSFVETIVGIRNLVDRGFTPRTNTVVMKPNYRHLSETISFLGEIGIKNTELMFVHPNGYAWVNREEIVPMVEDVIPYVKKAIDKARLIGINPTLIRFPICLLGDYKKYATEMFLHPKMIIESEKIRTRGQECTACKFYNRCSGIWSNYLKIYSFKFRPINSNDST
jgi:MoaA/NifB/PqqE/SkfB family radical SAM enzyme